MIGAASIIRLNGLQSISGESAAVHDTQFHSNVAIKSEVVVFPTSVREVLDVVRYCEEERLTYAAFGAGHHISGAGISVPEVAICLNKMKGVVVDAVTKTATVAPGATWAEFDVETGKYGLAATGGIVSHTGVFGLTLGGGFGWLMGEQGFACDNVVAAKIAVSNGNLLSVDAENHSDLFWALRGCGTEFGVVVELTFKLHSVPEVLAGSITYDLPSNSISEIASRVANAVNNAPDELTVSPQFLFNNGTPILSVDICATTVGKETQLILDDLILLANTNSVRKRKYHRWQYALDNPNRRSVRSHWETAFATSLTPEMIMRAGSIFGDAPSHMWLCSFDHIHGKAADSRHLDASCFPHRSKGVCLLINANWKDPAADESNISFASSMLHELSDDYNDKKYVNYVKRVGRDQARINYGLDSLKRLGAVKRNYNPNGCTVLQEISD